MRQEANQSAMVTNLETLVLKDSLDGRVFAAGRELGLKDNAEGPVADDLALGVLHLPLFASQPILHFLPDDLCNAHTRPRQYSMSVLSRRKREGREDDKSCPRAGNGSGRSSPPTRKFENTPERVEDIVEAPMRVSVSFICLLCSWQEAVGVLLSRVRRTKSEGLVSTRREASYEVRLGRTVRSGRGGSFEVETSDGRRMEKIVKNSKRPWTNLCLALREEKMRLLLNGGCW